MEFLEIFVRSISRYLTFALLALIVWAFWRGRAEGYFENWHSGITERKQLLSLSIFSVACGIVGVSIIFSAALFGLALCGWAAIVGFVNLKGVQRKTVLGTVLSTIGVAVGSLPYILIVIMVLKQARA